MRASGLPGKRVEFIRAGISEIIFIAKSRINFIELFENQFNAKTQRKSFFTNTPKTRFMAFLIT